LLGAIHTSHELMENLRCFVIVERSIRSAGHKPRTRKCAVRHPRGSDRVEL